MTFAVECATRHSADKPNAGGAAVALGLVLALSLGAGEARAQTACTPDQTVSDSPDEDGRYTTTLVCADVSSVGTVADYRHLHYNAETYTETVGVNLHTNPADRNTALTNNLASNNLALTIGRGIVFTAGGDVDMRELPRDGAILLWGGGAKTVDIENGATINLHRVFGTDLRGQVSVFPALNYPHWSSVLLEQDGVSLLSETSTGGGISVSHGGVINIGIDIQGGWGNRYGVNEGAAIRAEIVDNDPGEARVADDISIHVASTGVIRQVQGSDGLGGIFALNAGEDGDITIRLDKGSQIDLMAGGGPPAVDVHIEGNSNSGERGQTGSIAVYAAGTIRNRVKSRALDVAPGAGLRTINLGTGATRIESSGTIETVQATAIIGSARSSSSEQRDDPATSRIEGNVIDVTSGTVRARGNVAISANTRGDDTWTVRVAEGATVRAEFDAGPEGIAETNFFHSGRREWNGRAYIHPGLARGWRQVDRNNDGADDGLEPIVNAIAIGRAKDVAEGTVDRVIVDGTVQTVGGGYGDPAIYFQLGGAAVTVGPTGKVISDNGVAIVSGCRWDAPPECVVGVVGYVPPPDAELDTGDLSVTVARGGTVTGDIRVVNNGDLTVTVAGTVNGDLRTEGAGDLAVTVEEGGRIASSAMYAAAGALDLTVAGRVTGDLRPPRHGALTLSVLEGGVVPGTVHDPKGPLTVAGSIGRVLYSNGGKVTVAATGALTGVETGGRLEALRSDAGTLDVTVAGRVAGDLRPPPGGTLKLSIPEGGVIPGTVHDPEGPLTVAGRIGRVLYSNGGKVTVAANGALTGVETGGRVEALRSDAGTLDVTVAGRVAGDLRPPPGGALKLSIPEGGVIPGTVHDPEGPLTVAGRIGRVLYSNGGKVTVAATTGALTGVETGGRVEALRSDAGTLDVTVAGRVAGDLRRPPGGALKLSIPEGGVVTGTVHDPEGPLTVAGSIGRLLYSNGATVTVTETGRLTGVEANGRTEALRSVAGDLYMTVAGTVTGDIYGLGAGEHEVTVAPDATVTGVIHLAASTALVDGTAGAVFLDRGGEVAVGRSGRITGVDGVGIRSATGDFTGTIDGLVVGNVHALGSGDRTVEVRSGGAVTGDVRVPNGDAAGEARVEVTANARVAGVVEVPAPENLGLNGEVGRVVAGRGGVLTVGPTGAVTGLPTDGDAPDVSSRTGDLTVVVQVAPGETEADAMRRAPRRIEAVAGAEQVLYKLPESDYLRALGALAPGSSTPSGPFDLGLVVDGAGIRVVQVYAPRAQVYEALPSVLLGMNEPSGFHARMEAPRSPNGMWARAQASGGARDAKRSTSGPLSWKHRGHGVEAGMDIPLGDGMLLGVSAHHRRVSADVSGDAGDINLAGNGASASLAVDLADSVLDGVYADGRASATRYKARLSSGPRGSLQRDAEGVGHSVSLEAGRRMAWGRSETLGEVTLTPRARFLYSRVDMDAFTDSVGARVSLKDGVAKTARAGLRVEAVDRPAGSSLFGSVDVEREFAPETRVRVSGTDLKSESESTRLLVELGGSIEWGEGAYALRAAARYGSGADDYGGGVSLRMRF